MSAERKRKINGAALALVEKWDPKVAGCFRGMVKMAAESCACVAEFTAKWVDDSDVADHEYIPEVTFRLRKPAEES